MKITKISGIDFSDGNYSISENIYDSLTVVSETTTPIKCEKNKMESYWKSIMQNLIKLQ